MLLMLSITQGQCPQEPDDPDRVLTGDDDQGDDQGDDHLAVDPNRLRTGAARPRLTDGAGL